MLLLLTTLDICKKLTKDKFIELVLEWNENSPHQENRIPDIHWNGEHNIRFGNDRLWMEIRECASPDILAVRYEKVDDDGRVWNTDYIMNFDEMRMAIQLDRSYRADARSFDPKFSAPFFITMLIKHGYLKTDGILPVSQEPYYIDEDNARDLANIISGREKYRLPVIYVSKTRNNEDPVDIKALCNRVKGVAHVLVERDRMDNYRIQDLCNDSNAYNGAIDVYPPNQSAGNKRHAYQNPSGPDPDQLERVVQTVCRYSNAQQIESKYTWQGVNALILRYQLESQQARLSEAEAISNEKTESIESRLLDEFGEEMDEKDRRIRELEEQLKLCEDVDGMLARIDELEKESEQLREENKGLQAEIDRLRDEPILVQGQEKEFFEGETRAFVLSALEKELGQSEEKSRRRHVLEDILQANGDSHLLKDREREVKRLLKTYDRMTSPIEKGLRELGWTYTGDGAHYKLTYYGDNRYQTVLPKTPSDVRTGENAVSEITKRTL